jgi:carbamoyltransferase
MRILGISAFYHDSAAALIEDGRIVAAAQEERFTRRKFDANYPRHAIDYCLDAGGITLADVDYVAFYDKPFLKFERLLERISPSVHADFHPSEWPCRCGCAKNCF